MIKNLEIVETFGNCYIKQNILYLEQIRRIRNHLFKVCVIAIVISFLIDFSKTDSSFFKTVQFLSNTVAVVTALSGMGGEVLLNLQIKDLTRKIRLSQEYSMEDGQTMIIPVKFKN